MKNKIVTIHWLLIFVLLSACQGGLFNPPTATPVPSPTPTPIPSPTPSPIPSPTPTPIPSPTPTPFPDRFEGKFDVGGYALFIKCKGSGSPTVILEHGYDYRSWNEEHLLILDTTTRTCLYYRAGISPSDPAAKMPVTTQDQVTDLHNLLLKAGVPGPYVLAGHSIAGYNLLLFTQLYPKEVVGLVCVDCRSPWMTQRTLDILGPEKDSDSEYLKSYRRNLTIPIYLVYPDLIEKLDIGASEAQLQKITSLGDIPFIVLVASETPQKDENLPTELNEELKQLWQDSAEEMSKLSTHGRMAVQYGFDHFTILTAQATFDAIKDVVTKARANTK